MLTYNEELYNKRFSKIEIIAILERCKIEYKHASIQTQRLIDEFVKSFNESMFMNDCFRNIEK